MRSIHQCAKFLSIAGLQRSNCLLHALVFFHDVSGASAQGRIKVTAPKFRRCHLAQRLDSERLRGRLGFLPAQIVFSGGQLSGAVRLCDDQCEIRRKGKNPDLF